jgi:hypothetical protein
MNQSSGKHISRPNGDEKRDDNAKRQAYGGNAQTSTTIPLAWRMQA